MNRHLQNHIKALFEQHDRATLSTCGEAGPQISVVIYQLYDLRLHLLVPHTSDHLFNLDGHPDLVLLTPTWKLQGRGTRTHYPPLSSSWQIAIPVEPLRLHILDKNEQYAVETIDF